MRSRSSFSAVAALVACLGAGVAMAPRTAMAYPSTVVFAPTGEALPFGAFVLGAFGGMVVSPEPVSFASGWGGINFGVLPSFDLVQTPVGPIAFAGLEVGFDVYGPDEDDGPTGVLNFKVQLLKEAEYWPAVALGLFQASPAGDRGALLGYFALSKSFAVRGVELGQLTFGMMSSFAEPGRVAPGCFTSGARWCVFRGSTPFEDENGAIFGGYVSPWLGPVALTIDHVGGTSAVSSTNVAVNARFLEHGDGGYVVVGAGGFFTNDRRDSPPGPGAEDGVFLQVGLVSSLADLFGWDPFGEKAKGAKKPPARPGRRSYETILDAPPIEAPQPTPTPSSEPPQPTPTPSEPAP
ncbi:MAG: hypothetical protein R3B70_27950 [Polyangiaceae bacterium]